MTRKTSKTPQEIANELQARADRAKIRAVSDEFRNQDEIKTVLAFKASIEGKMNAARRSLFGANNCEQRLQALALRSAWIQAEKTYSEQVLAEGDSAIEEVNALLQSLAKGYSETGTVSPKLLDEFDDISSRMIADKQWAEVCNAAQNWRNFGKEMRSDAASN